MVVPVAGEPVEHVATACRHHSADFAIGASSPLLG